VTDETSELLQRYVDGLFQGRARADRVPRLEAVTRAEAADLPEDLIEIVLLLPPGAYSRQGLVDQLNSAVVAHGWSGRYGTVA
jgi:hypothetical protein